MTRLRESISAKITLLVLASTFVVFALVLNVNYRHSKELVRLEAEKAAKNLTSSLANEVEQEFAVVAQCAEDLAAFLETGTWDEETLLRHIRRMVTGNDWVYGSTVAFMPYEFQPDLKSYSPYYYKSPTGIRFEQLGTDSYNYAAKDWFQVPVERRIPVWSDPYFDEGGGDVVMVTFSRPLYHKYKDAVPRIVTGVVTADIALEQLNERVNAKPVYDTGYLAVISDKGTFVTNRDPDRIMRMSIFDVAKTHNDPQFEGFVHKLLHEESGFYDVGKDLTGVDAYLAFSKIRPPGWTLAAVIPKKELFAEIENLNRVTMISAAIGIALLSLVSFLVARSVSKPLRRMAQETKRVAEGHLQIDLSDITSVDEVGKLAGAFTRMTEGLRERDRIKDTFGRYVTQEVVKRILDSSDGLKLGGEMRELTIMMSDLRGFTALTANMRPDEVIRFLNRYLGKMVEIILDHRGIIDEIIGDGILAFFGAPEELENHPELAVACALRMQAAMEEINAMNEADGLPHLEMGIAVNTGEAVVGNIGSEKRAKYGAVGSQVNFTGRVESYTVGGQILVSKGTFDRLADLLDIAEVLEVEMKGVPGKTLLYDVRGMRGPYGATLPEQNDRLCEVPERMPVSIFRLDQKIVSHSGESGWIEQVSLTSATVIFENEVTPWEDIRMVVDIGSEAGSVAEIYGKVIAVLPKGDHHKGSVRFTSVSSDAYALLRRTIGT